MKDLMQVSKITMDDGKEYLVIDKIEDNEVIYLFLIDNQNSIAIRKYFKNSKNDEVYKLKDIKELSHAYELYLKKHEELKESL